jgi:hypothetical protein
LNVPDDLTEIKHVDEILKFLAAMTGDHSYSQIETKGVHNMCEVAQRLKREGASEGEDRMSKLILVLSEKGRMEDITKAAKNKKDREKLFKEFNL